MRPAGLLSSEVRSRMNMQHGSNVSIIVGLVNLFVMDLCDYCGGPLKINPLMRTADAI